MASASNMVTPTLISGFLSPSERPEPNAATTRAEPASAAEPLLGTEPRTGSAPAPWLPPPAGGSLQQSAAGTASGRAPLERVQSSLPDVQERVSASDAAADSDPEAAPGAASRAQLAHSASEVSIELYGSAPSALEIGGGSHDWGGRAGGGSGGSFSATSPRRAAALAAAISAAIGDDAEELSDDDATAVHPGAGADLRTGEVPFDGTLAWEHYEHDDQGHGGTGEGGAAQAGSQHEAAQSWPTWADSPAPSPSVSRAGQTPGAHSPARPLWLPSPVFSAAGESVTPAAAAAATPEKVLSLSCLCSA